MPRYDSRRPHQQNEDEPDFVPGSDHDLWHEMTTLDHNMTIEAVRSRTHEEIAKLGGMRVALEDLDDLLKASQSLSPFEIEQHKALIGKIVRAYTETQTHHAHLWRPLGVDLMWLMAGVMKNRLLLGRIIKIQERRQFVSRHTKATEMDFRALSTINEGLIRSCLAQLMGLDPQSDKDQDYAHWTETLDRPNPIR